MLSLQQRTCISRGLCDICARYDWKYHLARHPSDKAKDVLYEYDDAKVDDLSKESEAREDMQKQPYLEEDFWYQVMGLPYGGVYFIHSDGETTRWSWDSRVIQGPSTPHCSFCSLLTRAAQKANITLPLATSIQCRFTKPRSTIFKDPTVLSITFGVNTDDRMRQAYPHGLSFSLLEESQTEYFARQKLNPFQIDESVMRQWYKDCNEKHTYTCWPVSSGLNKEFARNRTKAFRVIDVTNDSVVPAPADCIYVALSYVWGDTLQCTLKKADLEQKSCSSSISADSFVQLERQKLARTIRDAMLVVEIIGERYLWIDSICIVQDDEDDLRENIHQMHYIYSEAALTIVAAGGDNADAGMAGLHPASRDIRPLEHVIELIHIVEIEPPLSLTLAKSTWNERAWTYQEYFFSEKALIFTNQRVYYECPGKSQSEVDPAGLEGGLSKILPTDTRLGFPYTYETHVREYSNRHSTFEHDVLNAFTAIMANFETRWGSKFCWGLPLLHFSRTLLWTKPQHWDGKTSALRRRIPRTNGVSFPSWSWAGWVGAIAYHTQVAERFDHYAYLTDYVITWPWDAGYDIEELSDPFDSGVLLIRVRMAVIAASTTSFEDDVACAYFDEDEPEEVDVNCILICIIGTAGEDRQPGEVVKHTHLAMAVERHTNGVYYRKGLVGLQTRHWEAAEIGEQTIRLG